MTVTHSIADRRIHTLCTGIVTYAECRAHMADRVVDDRIQPGMTELLDARGATIIDVSHEEMRELVAVSGRYGNRFREIPLAIVATAPVVYGVARMYELLSAPTGRPVGVVRTVREAEEWLANFDVPVAIHR